MNDDATGPTNAFREEVDRLLLEFDASLDAANTLAELDAVRVRFFGRKGGLVPGLYGRLKEVPGGEKREAGEAANRFRADVESRLKMRIEAAKESETAKKKSASVLDVTLPARKPSIGRLHPVTIARREIEDIFREMGYSIAAGPEIETDWYNFEALNFTPDHPARDTQDTFYIGESFLLRTHTSNVQIRKMEILAPPVKVVASGRVFRKDEISLRRSPMFHQVEGLLIDKGIHFGHLRGTLEHFIRKIFSPETDVRFRPSYFPFTEPSAEVDISCVFCSGNGCGTCSQTGWMEILGCGMVHPNVLRNVKIDPEIYTGFAFGLGIDRVAMLKYGIPNIRVLFENDLRVLSQF